MDSFFIIPVNWAFAQQKNLKNHCSPPFGPCFSGFSFKVVEFWGHWVLGLSSLGVVRFWGDWVLGWSSFGVVMFLGCQVLGSSSCRVVEFWGCCILGLPSFGVVKCCGCCCCCCWGSILYRFFPEHINAYTCNAVKHQLYYSYNATIIMANLLPWAFTLWRTFLFWAEEAQRYPWWAVCVGVRQRRLTSEDDRTCRDK